MAFKTDSYFKRIIARKDPRFDGRFYFGVKTTGIYCRPTCPAKPKPQNILIFPTTGDAERAGYRACLRCRPDIAPGMKRPDEAKQRVSRALKNIRTGLEDGVTTGTLANTLGMTDRHLRRLFGRYLGASPRTVLIARRLQRARRLLQNTSTPITDIAFAVGFQSIRRFNEAFKHSYRTPPSAFRRHA